MYPRRQQWEVGAPRQIKELLDRLKGRHANFYLMLYSCKKIHQPFYCICNMLSDLFLSISYLSSILNAYWEVSSSKFKLVNEVHIYHQNIENGNNIMKSLTHICRKMIQDDFVIKTQHNHTSYTIIQHSCVCSKVVLIDIIENYIY